MRNNNAFVCAMMLKDHSFSCLNRDQDGNIKQGMYGGERRTRISSQCIKKAIRAYGIFNENFRTSHLEDLVFSILTEMVKEGVIKESALNLLGFSICKTLNCDWGKKDNGGQDDETKRTIVVANRAEILTAVNAAIEVDVEIIAEKAMKEAKKDKEAAGATAAAKAVAEVVKKALNTVRISPEKAMFGTMATSGELDSVDGAVQFGQSYSIDACIPEDDYVTATYQKGEADASDPFFGKFNGNFDDFSTEQKNRQGSLTITNQQMSANVIYTPTCINVMDLKKNLSQSITHKPLDIEDKIVNDEIKECISDYLEAFAIVDPTAKQNSCSTHPAPAILYLEFIKDGNCQYASFNDAIVKRNKSIIAQGIEKILEFAKDDTFRIGDIHRYVMLPAPNAEYRKMFEEAGVKVIKNLNEIKDIVGAEIERMV